MFLIRRRIPSPEIVRQSLEAENCLARLASLVMEAKAAAVVGRHWRQANLSTAARILIFFKTSGTESQEPKCRPSRYCQPPMCGNLFPTFKAFHRRVRDKTK